MKAITPILLVCMLLIFYSNAPAQSNDDDAINKVKQAIKLEDTGNIDDAIALIEEAVKMAPNNYTCSYELAYAYSLKKDYSKTIEVAGHAAKLKGADDLVYQLIGNSYDFDGKSDKALKTYAEGLKKFPNSGHLYLETGVVHMVHKDYDKALAMFEKGLEVDPHYPSNYYWAAKLFLGSDEKVWGMIYGEIFMNLERNGKRTAEISKLLFDTYKSQITFPTDTSVAISFSKNNVMTLDDIKKLKMPYGTMVYEGTTAVAVALQRMITLSSLDTVRANFLDFYFQKFIKAYPVVLFYYQKEIMDAGHFEAYNHWLLMKGDEAEFTKWQADNKQKWDDFIKWYTNNPIEINNGNKFYRGLYN